MLGRLNLTVQSDHNQKSVMSDLSYTSPLKVMKPFYFDDSGAVFIYVMDVSGGMLAEDLIDYSVLVKQDAHLYLTTTSATKIHPMIDLEKCATIQNHFTVEANGTLEYFPEELILFENANLASHTVYELHSSAVLAFSEIFMMGRKHYGEMLKFTNMKSNLEIRIAGKIAVWDRFELVPLDNDFNDIGYMEQNSHYGSFYFYSEKNDQAVLKLVRSVIDELEMDIQVGSSLHVSGVIVIKALAHNHYSIKSIFKEIWKKVRPLLLKDELPYIRK